MPVSTDINLPKSKPPVFPDRCVACGSESPGSRYCAVTNAIGWWTWVFWIYGRRHKVEVPACESCSSQMSRQRWLQIAVNTVVIIAGLILAGWLFQWYHGPLKRWLMLGVALVCLLPVILWETFFPRPFDMTAFSETVDYEFRDPDYAAEFAALNELTPEE